MRLALLGVGLVGGSIARSIRRSADRAGIEIVAWTPNGSGARAARAAGVVDDVVGDLSSAIAGADLVVLAAPPLACLELLEAIGRSAALAPSGLVTDVASTKRAIVEKASAVHVPFVGGHPMAGRETSGFGASSDDLFVGRPWVVVPAPSSPPDGVERVEQLARWCGATPVVMSAGEHDEAVASISHAPLVLSAALAEAVAGDDAWPAAARLTAGGWASMTRLALGDPEMGAGILATNREPVGAQLHRLRDVLETWEADLDRADPDRLRARLEAARELLGGSETG